MPARPHSSGLRSSPSLNTRHASRVIGGTAPSSFAPQGLRPLRGKRIHPRTTTFTPFRGGKNRAVAFQGPGLEARPRLSSRQGVWGGACSPSNTITQGCALLLVLRTALACGAVRSSRAVWHFFCACLFLFVCGAHKNKHLTCPTTAAVLCTAA